MKKGMSKNQLSIKNISVAKHSIVQHSSLHQIKGGVVITEDIFGF